MATGKTVDESLEQLELILNSISELEERFADELGRVHPDYHASARNLIDYIALRHIDIRELQEQLSLLGLSSLGEVERNVMATVRSVQKALRRISTDTRQAAATGQLLCLRMQPTIAA